MLEDNHRVELRVYQQKVKHLEYEHRNNIKEIVKEGTALLEDEQKTHTDRERELLRAKEQMKFDQMELELVNANKIAELRSQADRQLVKLRQQFDDGLTELTSRCESRLRQLEENLALRRRVEVHEVEERKNQHINDLKQNHKSAFKQMKAYYNDITAGNLQVIKELQKKIVELKEQAINNKQKLLEYTQLNQKLSAPLAEVTAENAELQALLRERTKDQMALRNAHSRLGAIGKSSTDMRRQHGDLEEEYAKVERERDQLYNTFEDSIERIQQQSEFHNQALAQRLKAAEASVEKASLQVEEIIRAANLDSSEMARVMETLNQMLAAKDEALRNVRFLVVKLKKTYNDSLETFGAKLRDLGVPETELAQLGFAPEDLPTESTGAPANLIYKS